MRKWWTSILVGAIGAVVVAAPLAVAAPAPAAAPVANGSPGQGLEISPPVLEISANPGQTVTSSIRIRNITSGELIAKGRADDFGAGTDESGQPKLLLDETGATRYSLKYWVAGVPDLDLQPKDLKTANVTIHVPANAEPGGHFGVIRFTAVPPNLNGTGVALSASVGTLVLLKVSGPVTDKLSLAQFSAGQNGKLGSFFEHGPVDFLVRVKNDGTVHEKAKGTIQVTSMTGKKVAVLNVNSLGGNVLPDSIRRFTQSMNEKQLFGHYTAKLSLTYANNVKLNGTIGFWIIPWKLLLLALIGLIVIFFLLKLGLKKYNEHIINMARRR